MNAVVRSIEREELPSAGEVTLVVVPHPLMTVSMSVPMPAGLSLERLSLRAADIAGGRFRFKFVATINGDPIGEELWHCVYPHAGTIVTMRSVAEFGGDNDLLKTLLGAAVAIGGMVLTAINPFAGAAFTIAGQLLLNGLFPTVEPQIEEEKAPAETYSISGGQNVADPFGVVPTHLGRVRVWPKLGAKSYTEFVGADQYLRMLLVWGYGPLEISDIKIGETPIGNFEHEIETYFGYPGDPAPKLFPKEVLQEDLTIDLSVEGGAQTRTTAANIDEISVDVVAPGGILRVANSVSETYEVILRIDYSPTGAGAWTLLDTITLSGRSRDPIRSGVRKAVVNGQYDVRVTKTSADATTDDVVEVVAWTALRGFRNSPPISFDKPLAVTALRIKATSQLGGVVDEVNGLVGSRCASLVDGEWVDDTVSNWPHDLFRHVAQGPANARPIDDGNVDLEALELWAPYCIANGFRFNQTRDFSGSVYDALAAIASAGRAAVRRDNGKWSVVWDDPDAPIVQHFTPRNSWGFGGGRKYRRPPHGWRVRFINERAGYAQDERIVYDDGYTAENATLFEGIEFPGVTDPDLIWKHGRFHIAQARLRPEQYVINTDFEQLACSRGARVRVTHDIPLWGLGFGRVVARGPEGDNDLVMLDEPVTMEDGQNYVMRFRLSDGSSIIREVVTDDGRSKAVLLGGHGELPAVGDLFTFGLAAGGGQESVILRVLKVQQGPNLSAKITLVDDAPGISVADQGEIPVFDSRISVPADPFTAAPVNLDAQEAYQGIDGAAATGVLFSWETLAGNAPVSFIVEYRDEDGDRVWKLADNVSSPTKAKFIPDLLRGRWSLGVTAVFASGRRSRRAELANTAITGGSQLALPDVTNLVMSYKDSTSALTWDEVKYNRLEVRYEIRKGDSWESGNVLGVDIAHPPFTTYGNGTYWVSAKAQPLPGITIYSPNPTNLNVEGSILVRNVLATLDEQDNGWTGAITGPAEVDGETVRTTEAGVLAAYELAADRIFDIGRVGRVRIETSWKVVGVPETQNILDDPDFLNNPDILSAESSQFVEAWAEIAIAGEPDADVYAGDDVYVGDVYAGAGVFGDYQKFAPGEYHGRYFKLRMVMRSNSDSVYAALINWSITADVPDRIDHVTNYALDAGGETFTFTPDGTVDPKAFKGGPGTAIVPNVQVTWSEQAGDHLVITGLSLASVTIQILNGGVGVARTINANFQGW